MTLDAVASLRVIIDGAVCLVAAGALAGSQWYVVMVHLHGVQLPEIRVMAGVALVGGGNMAWRLADRADIVVAAYAGSQGLVVKAEVRYARVDKQGAPDWEFIDDDSPAGFTEEDQVVGGLELVYKF